MRHVQPRYPLGRLSEAVIIAILAGPVLAGLAGSVLPAFGYFPAIGGKSLSLVPLTNLFAAPGIFISIALSLATGLAATFLSLAITTLFTAAWVGTAAFERLRRFLSPLLAVPHAAAAFGLAFLIAPSGFLMRLLSPWVTGFERPPDLLILNDPVGITLTAGLVMKEIPFLFLMILAAIPQSDCQRLMKISSSLGYGRTTGFLKICLPPIYRRIRLPVLAVLAYSTSVVDMAQILGPTTPASLAPRVLDWMNDPDPAVRLQASAGAVLQLLLTACAIFLWFGIERVTIQVGRIVARDGVRHRREALPRLLIVGVMSGFTGVLISGILLLPLWSTAKKWWFPDTLPDSLSFQLWQHLDQTAGPALMTTFLIAVPVTLTAACLVTWHLESQTRRTPAKTSSEAAGLLIDSLIFLPLMVPQISFLFGLQVLLIRFGFDGSLSAVWLVHLIFVLPYVYLSLKAPWRELDPRYAKLAASLGASENRIFRDVRLPLLLRPLLTASAVGVAVSVAQYLPTLMIGAGRLPTITTESLALSSGGNRPLIALYATLQLLLPLAGFSLAGAISAVLYRNRSAMRASQ